MNIFDGCALESAKRVSAHFSIILNFFAMVIVSFVAQITWLTSQIVV